MNELIKHLPDAELEIMLVVWRSDRALHTGEILQRLSGEKPRRIQSVQVLLGRLAEKGFVQCEKTGRLNYYRPLVEEERYRRQETQSFIDRLYERSPGRLLAALVQDHSLSEEDLADIRRILDQEGG